VDAVEWLADQLAARARPYSAHVALYQAYQVRGAWVSWYWRYDTFVIEVDDTKLLYAQRVPVERGTLDELRRLLVAAEGTKEEYDKGWLGTSGGTLRWVIAGWEAVPPRVIWRKFNAEGRLVGFERADFVAAHRRVAIDGHVRLIPPQHEAVPLIKVALRRYQATTASERRKRKVDDWPTIWRARSRMPFIN
jgi:hypothetical protein